jgi:hypothetical protein
MKRTCGETKAEASEDLGFHHYAGASKLEIDARTIATMAAPVQG